MVKAMLTCLDPWVPSAMKLHLFQLTIVYTFKIAVGADRPVDRKRIYIQDFPVDQEVQMRQGSSIHFVNKSQI